MRLEITQAEGFFLGKLGRQNLSQEERLAVMNHEETRDEFAVLVREAEALADPMVLFGVCAVEDGGDQTVCVNGVGISSGLVREKLGGKKRCFPFIATCGTALADWSRQYQGDFLAEFWADEIQKLYLNRITSAFFRYLQEQYRTAGHLTALNPGSLKGWPLAGQQELFQIFGGTSFVKRQIGVEYTESFLVLPFKSISGIAFESDTFYENCQYCPLTDCPNRRAAYKLEEVSCTA